MLVPEVLKSKKTYVEVGIIIALILAAFSWGKYSNPAKVEYRDKIVTQEKVVTQKIYVASSHEDVKDSKALEVHKNVRKEITTEKRPDGTVVTKTVVTDQSVDETKIFKSDIKLESTSTQTLTQKEFTKTEDHYKLVETKQPSWMLGVGVGYYLPTLWGHSPDFNLIPYKGLIGSISLQKRLVGPFWAGPFVSTMGEAGLTMSLTF